LYFANRYKEAIGDLLKAVELGVSNKYNAYYYTGASYAKLSDYKTAIVYYSKAIELDDTNANAYFDRGFAYWRLTIFQTRSPIFLGRSNSIRPEPTRMLTEAAFIINRAILKTPRSTRKKRAN
jgi:tetratricopeptide (TPR) repeat protein